MQRYPLSSRICVLTGLLMLAAVLAPSLSAQRLYRGGENGEFFQGVPDSLLIKIRNAVPSDPAIQEDNPARLLVFNLHRVHGEVRSGHASIPYTNYAIHYMGETTGAWETWFSNDTLVFHPDILRQFDAICFNNTAGVLFDDQFLRQSLLDYVFSGGGFIGLHAAGATFCQWPVFDQFPEFGEMLGGFESGGHPWGPYDTITLRLEEPDHPVNRAFAGKGFQASDEVFQFTEPYTRDKLRILLGIDTDLTDMSEHRRILPERRADLDIAISWVRRYGRGKVFYTSFGHNAHLSWNPGIMGHYFDGIRFASNLLDAPYTPSGRLTPALKAQEQLGWRFGIEAYTFRNNTLFETIDRTRELGLQYVGGLNVQKVSDRIPRDFDYNLSDEELLEVRRKLADAGLSMLTYYIFDIPGDRETVTRIFEFGRKMGIETFISEPAIENLDIIEEFCENYNIKLAIHNHGEWLSPVYMHPEKIVELTEGRSPLIGAACDFGHWAKEGIDPLKAIKTLGHRVITLQMHDQSAMDPKGHDVPWGTGVIDLEGILRHIKENNIRPVMFGLEYSYNWDHSLPEIKESIEFFNRVSLELAGSGDRRYRADRADNP
jgi:sugar phosphate isomerase/epimerase/type 1 glutamine amidotransferase